MSEYCVLYWAAACLVFWAGGGSYVSDGTLMQAVDAVCEDAKLTVPQEVLLKRTLNNMMKGDENGTN